MVTNKGRADVSLCLKLNIRVSVPRRKKKKMSWLPTLWNNTVDPMKHITWIYFIRQKSDSCRFLWLLYGISTLWQLNSAPHHRPLSSLKDRDCALDCTSSATHYPQDQAMEFICTVCRVWFSYTDNHFRLDWEHYSLSLVSWILSIIFHLITL